MRVPKYVYVWCIRVLHARFAFEEKRKHVCKVLGSPSFYAPVIITYVFSSKAKRACRTRMHQIYTYLGTRVHKSREHFMKLISETNKGRVHHSNCVRHRIGVEGNLFLSKSWFLILTNCILFGLSLITCIIARRNVLWYWHSWQWYSLGIWCSGFSWISGFWYSLGYLVLWHRTVMAHQCNFNFQIKR